MTSLQNIFKKEHQFGASTPNRGSKSFLSKMGHSEIWLDYF